MTVPKTVRARSSRKPPSSIPGFSAVLRSDRGYRKWGGGIIEAFYDGFNALECQDWAFMCKLDGDLSFDPGYFEGTFRKFGENPKIGIGGGVLYHCENGKRVLERTSSLPCQRRREDFSARVLECDWRALGWAGFGYDRRGQGEHAWVDDDEFRRSRDDSSSAYRSIVGSLGRNRQERNRLATWRAITRYTCLQSRSLLPCVRPLSCAPVALMYGYMTAYLKGIPRVERSRVD